MPFELTEILNQCDEDDYRFLVDTIDNYLSLTDEKKLNNELAAFRMDPSYRTRPSLNEHIEDCIRYLGSADIAYIWRSIFSSGPAGVPVDEIIDDICEHLKVSRPRIGPTRARLNRLALRMFEKTFFDLKPEQQRDLLKQAGLSSEQQGTFFAKLGANKAILLPLVLSTLGTKVAIELIEGVVMLVLARYLGRAAAAQVLKQFFLKVPWMAEWLGPVVWAISLSWLAFDVQGPAFRKTVPCILYLGIVSLRDTPPNALSDPE